MQINSGYGDAKEERLQRILVDFKFTDYSHETLESVTVNLKDLFEEYGYIPKAKAIPIELYEQVKGERDVAIEQLKSLNIELFEKPYLKAITIEFLEKWFGDNYNALTDLEIAWEKENGRSD